jgi:hypothetical protein
MKRLPSQCSCSGRLGIFFVSSTLALNRQSEGLGGHARFVRRTPLVCSRGRHSRIASSAPLQLPQPSIPFPVSYPELETDFFAVNKNDPCALSWPADQNEGTAIMWSERNSVRLDGKSLVCESEAFRAARTHPSEISALGQNLRWTNLQSCVVTASPS